ncbi:MAG: hypothetical protein AB8G99_15245 [Planctomycetaceae bacterium]
MRPHIQPPIFLVLLFVSTSLAQDELKTATATVRPRKQTSDQNEPERSDRQAAEVLQSAIDGMNQSLQAFQRNEVSKKTIETQAAVVSSLDELIQLAKAMQSKSQSGTQRQPLPNNANSKKPQNKPDDPKAGQPDGAKQNQSQQRKRPDDSQDSSGPTKGTVPSANGTASPRRVLVKEVWGHLPPALRRRLLSTAEEKPIPRYQGLVEQYFRAIAEQPQQRKRLPPSTRPQK